MPRCPDRVLAPELLAYVRESEAAFGGIPGSRREELERIAGFVRARLAAGAAPRLTFICTHNSRRSHLAQVWAWTATAHRGVHGVEVFSGGTEATAFHRGASDALARAGFLIERGGESANPVVRVRFRGDGPALECFSKVYDRPPNPVRDFCAVMTCARADAACPVVAGAALRVAIPYEDPKEYDGTAREEAAYDERCRQIAVEMLYAFSAVGE